LKYVLEKFGIEKKEYDEIMARPPKSFMDYPNYYRTIKKLKYPIKIAWRLKLLPAIVYEKYAR
jgi:hypothetical protein